MDDILASIRRIISEDATPEAPEDDDNGVDVFKAEPFKGEDHAEASSPEPAPAEPVEGSAEAETEAVTEVAAESIQEAEPDADADAPAPEATFSDDEKPAEADASANSVPHKESVTVSKTDSTSDVSDDPLVGEASASATTSAFDSLKSAAGDAARDRAGYELPAPGRTLEDLTTDLLRPILKTWLDENLPSIVQLAVNEEVARLARGRAR
jgi:hypothetical protein